MKTRVIKGWRTYSAEPEKTPIRPKPPQYDFKPLEDVVRKWVTGK